jgi:hypothetical protein
MNHTNQDRLCADRKEREMTDEKRAADDAERDALVIAEAALADIGDAEREPGDDLAWCERRAAQALPAVRAALSARADGGKDSSDALVDGLTESIASLLDRIEDLEPDAIRYRCLRSRDLDVIVKGGVFAGKVPDNVVLNGDDLDAAIDAAIAGEKK